MPTQLFLGFSALVWAGYGLYCFMVPTALADMNVITAASATGTVEIKAMYGGLQTALGVLALMGLLRSAMIKPALTALAFATGGLFIARSLGALMAANFSAYTSGALVFELLATLIAVWLLKKQPA
ncbi:DUF4345 family protein [Spongiibacter nanhainus]|uniref:DUF4345 family protein n=1 Tax=Spongiibacter nanhainus TaxID=2794344 RepID=A0A7T4R146_9GAMM|nr:DUF4345 family protein [Spongiibacter nanhainus]QQD18409.1 DUF4345 family protein [Spongiibacter nanhainus]